MKRWLSTLAMVVVLALPWPVRAAPVLAAGNAPITVVKPGSVFSVPVVISDAQALQSWQFDLSFDSAVLQLIGVSEGPFMPGFGTTLFSPGFDLGGLLGGVAGSYVDLAPLPAGSGVIASLEFTALGLGSSVLSFSNVFVNFSDQGFSAVDGVVHVVPAPGGPWLMVLAFAALGLAACRRPRPATAGP